jgi:murein DD-endopeptidase MepM/ murein hydrolase activator NlpD
MLGLLLLLLAATGCGSNVVLENTNSAQAQAEPTATLTLAPTVSVAKTAPPTPTATTTPTPRPTATATPAVGPLPIPTVSGQIYTRHIVKWGQTLNWIAMRYEMEPEELIALNHLDPAGELDVGQSLRVPLNVEQTGPAEILLPDSEVVYSPAYVDFDIEAYIKSQGGYLSGYYQYIEGEKFTGPQVVERVAREFSVGPRVLLALLEYHSGWVTHWIPPDVNNPLGPRNPMGNNLYLALTLAADELNAGYYGYKRDGYWVFTLSGGGYRISASGLNAGTVGLQNVLAQQMEATAWPASLGEVMGVYRRLFGDPFERAIEPLVPANLTQPPLVLPWEEGRGFYLTGGPHPAFYGGSAWAAIDFGPPDILGSCIYSAIPNTAAAPGVIVTAQEGEVQLDLDGDGHIQTGWVLLYLHMALDFDIPVEIGHHVETGDIIGYASCQGGASTSSHLHLARRYNGEWIEAAGPIPMELGGWQVQHTDTPYEGTLAKGDEVRASCECWEDDKNLILNPGE